MTSSIARSLCRKLVLVLTSLLAIASAVVITTTPVLQAHAAATACPHNLSFGSNDNNNKNGPVHQLQKDLNAAWNNVSDAEHSAKNLPYSTNSINFSIAPDGNFGTTTLAAVVDYQTAHKLKVIDGLVGPETWNSLTGGCASAAGNSNTGYVCYPNISENSTDQTAIKTLQQLLKLNGANLIPDGKFGSATNAAVITIQKKQWPHDQSLWDGKVGWSTWRALYSCGNGVDEYGNNTSGQTSAYTYCIDGQAYGEKHNPGTSFHPDCAQTSNAESQVACIVGYVVDHHIHNPTKQDLASADKVCNAVYHS